MTAEILMSKSKAALVGVILAIGGLAALGLSSLTKGCDSGRFGLGPPGSSGTSSVTAKGNADSATELVITLDGEKYLVNGSPRSLDDVISAAVAISQNQTSDRESPILIKKKNARYMTVQKLEEELKRRGIRYRTEDEFR
jgi:hypothetical protein